MTLPTATPETPSDPAAELLSVELQGSLLRELQRAWHGLNAGIFRGVLLPPTLALERSQRRLGLWQRHSRTLSMSLPLCLKQPWVVVLEVLKHEMAHQYVSEILGREADDGEGPHGPLFQAVCDRFGIDATAAGLPALDETEAETTGSDPGPAGERARLLRKVARLLALAESPSRPEAESAMREAQRLMLKYNIDQAAAERSAGQSRGGAPVLKKYGVRHVGEPRTRIDESQRLLAMVLGRHFFVEAIWVPSFDVKSGKRGTVLELCGTTENLELATYVHGFLSHTAERLWVEHKRTAGLRGDAERRTFLSGVMLGFAEKLSSDEKQQQAEGLVWVGDRGLEGFLRKRHPHVRKIYQKGHRPSAARTKGREAGRNIVLHKPIASGSSAGPRALPPRR